MATIKSGNVFFISLPGKKQVRFGLPDTIRVSSKKMVFNGQINEQEFGIKRHDFVGWEGGQTIVVDGFKFSVGFSGFRAASDLEIVRHSIAKISQLQD